MTERACASLVAISRVNVAGKRVRAVARDRLEHTSLGDTHRRQLRVDVAEGEVRQPHVLDDDAHDIVDQLVVASKAHPGQAQPFLIDDVGIRRDDCRQPRRRRREDAQQRSRKR